MDSVPDGDTDRPGTPLDRGVIGVWRIGALLFAGPVLLGALALATRADLPLPLRMAVLAAAVAVAIWRVLLAPPARYRAWAYDLAGDELLVQSGVLVQLRTVVPLARVQHIDVAQGPLERRAGLGTLTVHTAGTGSSDVDIPGLPFATAEALRDRIRVFIRAESEPGPA